MPRECKKTKELRIFGQFLRASSLPSGAFESMDPPAPDILYTPITGHKIAFELSQVMDEDLARELSEIQKRADPGRNASPPNLSASSYDDREQIRKVVWKKLKASYTSQHPLFLLLYVDGGSILPDDVVAQLIQQYADACNQLHSIEQIWYHGENEPLRAWTRLA